VIGALALLVGVGLAIVGQQALTDPRIPLGAWVWFAGAAALATYGLSRLPDPEPCAPLPPHELPARARRLAGGLAMVAAVGVNVWALSRLWHSGVDRLGIAGWGVSLGAFCLGGWLYGALQRRRPEQDASSGPPQAISAPPTFVASESAVSTPTGSAGMPLGLEIILVACILAGAIFLRVYRLDQAPPGIFVDETNAALDAIAIMEGRPDSPFGTGWFETPTMYAYYLVGLFKVFGTTFVALKVASILPGVLTVLALYPLGRLMFGAPTALVAMFILAASRWHFNMSRWGWNEVAPPLFQLGATYFLLRGARSRQLRDFALGGLLLGLGMYTYLASRLVVGVILAYLVYRAMVERGFLRRAWVGLLVFWLAYALTFAPLASTYVRNPFTFLNRSRQVSILNDVQRAGGSYAPVRENLKRHLLMFHVRGDSNPRHNLPGAPMLDPATGILFVFGLAYSLWHWRDHRRGLLLLWIPITLLGGILSSLAEGPQGYRTLGVVPAVALLAGDALVRGWKVLLAVRIPVPRVEIYRVGMAIPWALGMLTLGYIGWQNYALYFRVQANDQAVYVAFAPAENAVALEVLAHLSERTYFLSPRLYHFSPLRYLTYRPVREGGGLARPPYRLFQGVDDLPLTDVPDDDVALLLDAHFGDLLDVFRAFYPSTMGELVRGKGGEALYLSVVIPAQEIAALRGLEGRYEMPDGRNVVRRDAQINFHWETASPAGGIPRRVTWSGSLALPASGLYAFRAEGDLRVELDGRLLTEEAVFLGKGLHSLQVVQENPAEAGVARLYWSGPGGREGLIPADVLFAVPAWEHGLRGTYYRGDDFQEPPVFSRVDPLILFAWPEPEPWHGPFSARWSGEIEAPVTGSYTFRLEADDGVRLWLDDRLLGEAWVPDRANHLDAHVELSEGRHRIRIEFFQRGGAKVLEFWWAVPGQPMRPVPPAVLFPASADRGLGGPPEEPVGASASATEPQPQPMAVPFSLRARQVYTGTTESKVWEVFLGQVAVQGGALTVRVSPVAGYDAVYDYLRIVGRDGKEQRVEAEDLRYTAGDQYSPVHLVDGHWWLQNYEPFSGGKGLVAIKDEGAPVLTTVIPLADGEYDLYLGTFTGDPANGPFAVAVDFKE